MDSVLDGGPLCYAFRTHVGHRVMSEMCHVPVEEPSTASQETWPLFEMEPINIEEECNEASSQNFSGRRRCNSPQRGTCDLMRHEAAKGA